MCITESTIPLHHNPFPVQEMFESSREPLTEVTIAAQESLTLTNDISMWSEETDNVNNVNDINTSEDIHNESVENENDYDDDQDKDIKTSLHLHPEGSLLSTESGRDSPLCPGTPNERSVDQKSVVAAVPPIEVVPVTATGIDSFFPSSGSGSDQNTNDSTSNNNNDYNDVDDDEITRAKHIQASAMKAANEVVSLIEEGGTGNINPLKSLHKDDTLQNAGLHEDSLEDFGHEVLRDIMHQLAAGEEKRDGDSIKPESLLSKAMDFLSHELENDDPTHQSMNPLDTFYSGDFDVKNLLVRLKHIQSENEKQMDKRTLRARRRVERISDRSLEGPSMSQLNVIPAPPNRQLDPLLGQKSLVSEVSSILPAMFHAKECPYSTKNNSKPRLNRQKAAIVLNSMAEKAMNVRMKEPVFSASSMNNETLFDSMSSSSLQTTLRKTHKKKLKRFVGDTIDVTKTQVLLGTPGHMDVVKLTNEDLAASLPRKFRPSVIDERELKATPADDTFEDEVDAAMYFF
eukprot:TRINITY_DN48_c0_g3_i1.p2 TRINITY_DN48_c0_g3~~TRINITY_DN48_c0_g3_i1.p2  ORF type:complete len:516 (-),score=174.37 TRINITY_DN48_c0_g3_i1:134-1681(-)